MTDRILSLIQSLRDKIKAIAKWLRMFKRDRVKGDAVKEDWLKDAYKMRPIATSDRLNAKVRALAVANNIFSGMLLTFLKSPSDLPPDDYRQIQALARIAWSDTSIKVRSWLLHTYSDLTNVAILTIVNINWYRLSPNEQTTVLTAITKMVLSIMGKLPEE